MLALDPKKLPSPKEETWKYTDLPKALKRLDLKPAQLEFGAQKIISTSEELNLTLVEGGLYQPQITITLKDNEEATIVETHSGEGAYWLNMATSITLAPGSRLKHYRIQEHSTKAIYTQMSEVSMAENSTYEAFTMATGAGLSRNQMHIELNGEGAAARIGGLTRLGGAQHGDTTLLINHNAPHTTSQQNVRYILDEKSRGVFQGKVHVAKPAQKTVADQLCKTILLSGLAEMDSKPELEIYADDVQCSHGATTGQLDADALFYLRSRGISDDEARTMLVEAFAQDVIETITDDAFREKLQMM